MTFSVRPAESGGWLAFASEPRLLLVQTSDDVTSAWAALGGPDGFQASLDLLTSKGLAATPPFVLVEWEDGGSTRIVLRGETTIEVTDASGSQQLSATGVSTWVERSMPGVIALDFVVPGARPAGSAELPLASGVALVAAITVAGDHPAPSASRPPAGTSSAVASSPPAPTVVAPPAPAPAEEDIGATVREAPDARAEAIAAPPPPQQSEGYDYLFGETMYRNVADAAVHEPEADVETPDPQSSEPAVDALHDGETVMTSDIAKLRGKRRPRAAEPPRPPAAQQLVLVLPSGAREALTQSILVGRSPSVSKVSGGQIPRLLTVGTADQDISRNHAQFVLEGGTVVVTDLHSKNGTSIVLPGKSPQKLRAGEPTSVIVGTVVDLGGGITITVDED